jgi:phytoene desaturase
MSVETTETTRIAVVGSGFGGLAAAIRLQVIGCRVVLFEARDQPGGRAHVIRDSGFTFDAGPTVITAPHCLEELFEIAGRKLADYVTLVPVDPFYRLIWDDGTEFDYVGDRERLHQQIAAINPNDVAGYERFLKYSKRVFDKGYTELANVPFLRFSDMVRVAPDLVRLRADRSVYAAVSRFIKDERLRLAFSFHSLLVGGHPYKTSSIYTLIHFLERQWGVFFPLGGTGALVAALVRLFEELGGELRLSSPVDGIRLASTNGSRSKHLVSSKSKEEAFDAVVSNADLMETYGRIYRGSVPAEKTARRLQRMEWSMSLFVLYFGVKRRYLGVAHHTILFGPRYRGLLDDVFRGPKLADDLSLYLHAPTVTDPSLAPVGCEAFYVLSPVPHLGKANIDWTAEAPRYAERILERLERWLPDLRKEIVVKRWITPFDFRDDLRSHHGSAFSVAPLLRQSAWFRPHNADRRIPGLYLVGAGTHPGAGVPGVVNSAKATAKLVAADFGLHHG